MFSHPADFTPVCTTEFMAFANIYATAEMEKRMSEGYECKDWYLCFKKI